MARVKTNAAEKIPTPVISMALTVHSETGWLGRVPSIAPVKNQAMPNLKR